MQALDEILHTARLEIQSVANLQALDECRVFYLGKKGKITEQLKKLGELPADERPQAGQKINSIKETLQSEIEKKKSELEKKLIDEQLKAEFLDITLSGRHIGVSHIHPITKTIITLENIFTQMGFEILQGPEIEDDYHNFTALNIPPLHPARAMADTFYILDPAHSRGTSILDPAHSRGTSIQDPAQSRGTSFKNDLLLRTHMSPVQIHSMKQGKPPLRMVAIGRVYRRDFDLTHTPMFHQMEGLMIDKNLSLADLKGLLTIFLNAFFEKEISIRFRPSYFPFTEPSAEVDIGCQNCNGKGCRICKQTGWLEVLGSGMVHPNVLNNVGIDSNQYSGFAFGLGIDRLTMLKYGIADLRSLFENDLRFLKQF